ncbi:MAG: thioesterase [Treponema sp.]|nr:thioesterase [Treponema sp.]
MEKLAIWSEDFLVRFNAIDRSDTMTLSAVLNVFQELAVSHAENLGVGREAMASTGQAWILSRMSVQVDRRPNYCEAVTVRSWPRSWEKLFALRDFDVLDAQGSPIIRARSCWIIIDMEKRRPIRPQSALEGIHLNEGLDALPFVPASLEERQSMQKMAEYRALYNDVDYNGHVNNVSYIRWVENALDPSILEQAKRSRLDINYMNEVRPGEVVDLWSANIDLAEEPPVPSHAFTFAGKKAHDGQTAFRAELRLWL